MPHTCFVNGCHNRSDDSSVKRSFFAIPTIIAHQGEKTEELSTTRRKAWIARINRKKNPTKYSKVCSDHFVHGKPADLYKTTHPDWAPSLKMIGEAASGVGKNAESNAKKMNRYQRAKDRQVMKIQHDAAHALLDLSTGMPSDATQDATPAGPKINCVFQWKGKLAVNDTSCDDKKQCDQDDESVTQLQADYQKLMIENHLLKNQLLQTKYTPQSLEGNDSKVKYLTGLPSYVTLMAIFSFIEDYLGESIMSSLTKFQKYVMVLMKLRLNSPIQDLAFRFCVSKATVSRTFSSVIHVMYKRLTPLIHWPGREELHLSMPMGFRENYGVKIAVIVDCFEIFVERPSNLLSRSETWSHYKHHNTVKFLIGITPQGSISFLSEAWGGRTTDKYITEHCGILNHLVPGDLVLADRGFDIAESVGLMCAEVKIPAFTRGKQQLSPLEVESTRKIANVRIHVERVIGLLRNKYTILQGTLPIDFLTSVGNEPLVDKIVRVCAALTNCCESVVPFN